MTSNLTDAINRIIKLTAEDKIEIESKFVSQSYSAGDYIEKDGEYCNHIYFVAKGRLRIFYLDKEGNEISCFFANENDFVSSYTSFLTNTPSKQNIQAIEGCTLLSISKTELDKLSESIPKFHQFRRIIAENLFITMERRIAMLQSQSAQEAYENMISENAEMILNIPQQYLASFLGITPQHLSRIRKKIK